MEGDPNDPERLSPEDRVREVARILATGYLRLLTLRAPEASAPPSPVPEALPATPVACPGRGSMDPEDAGNAPPPTGGGNR